MSVCNTCPAGLVCVAGVGALGTPFQSKGIWMSYGTEGHCYMVMIMAPDGCPLKRSKTFEELRRETMENMLPERVRRRI